MEFKLKGVSMKIGLIACCSKKKNITTRAEQLYDSTLFKYSLKYLQKNKCDKIYILSAKYGLLRLDDVISPYNETLNSKSTYEIKTWSDMVLEELQKNSNLKQDEYIILAGAKYRKYILPYLSRYIIPLKGLGIGKQLKFLKENLNE